MSDLGLQRGTVRLEEYNPEWRNLFEQEKELLLKTFGSRIIAIEHIGSTAIPGLESKPIIDISVAVESLDDIDDFITKLQELGYEYMPERRFSDRQFFPKGPAEKRTHHVSLVEITSETGWNNHILFRDYLREHADVRNEYAKLKRELAEKYADNRGEYTERKKKFVMEVINHAKIAMK
ncbi:MAG TPA: GrpB family protein [Candidatus Paceibacterota bacterium]